MVIVCEVMPFKIGETDLDGKFNDGIKKKRSGKQICEEQRENKAVNSCERKMKL